MRIKTILRKQYGENLLEQSLAWWNWRALVIAGDKAKEVGPTNLDFKMYLRRN